MSVGVERAPCTVARHVPPAPPGAERLHWMPTQHAGSGTMRLNQETCGRCGPISYEYGVLGGAFRIRRTNHKTGRIHETPAVPRPQAAEWWQALLEGRAI